MNNRGHELCRTCKYRTRMSMKGHAGENAVVACYYIMITGERRGCDWRDCTKYVESKRPARPIGQVKRSTDLEEENV